MNKYRVVFDWHYYTPGDDFADSWGQGCEETIYADNLADLKAKLASDIVACGHEEDEVCFTCYDENGKDVLDATYTPRDGEITIEIE